REVPGFHVTADTRFLAKVLGSATLMGLVVFAWKLIFEQRFDTSQEAFRVLEVSGGLALGAACYAGLLHVLHVDEARALVRRLLDIIWTLIRRNRRIDILILHVYGGASFIVEDAASLIGRRAGHRIIMLLHGGALPEFISSFPRWTRRVLERADAIVAPSLFL